MVGAIVLETLVKECCSWVPFWSFLQKVMLSRSPRLLFCDLLVLWPLMEERTTEPGRPNDAMFFAELVRKMTIHSLLAEIEWLGLFLLGKKFHRGCIVHYVTGAKRLKTLPTSLSKLQLALFSGTSIVMRREIIFPVAEWKARMRKENLTKALFGV